MAEQSEHSRREWTELIHYFGHYRSSPTFTECERGIKALLTPKPELVSQDTDPLPRLQYFPEYIADLIVKKNKLKKKCEENVHQNDKYSRRYNKVRQQIRSKIRQHAAILKWFDLISESDQSGDERNHFSTSLDTDRVQSLINYFRQNEGDPFFLSSMIESKEYTTELGTRRQLKDKPEAIHFFYFWYAVYAAYEDIVLVPPFYDQMIIMNDIEDLLSNMELMVKKRRK